MDRKWPGARTSAIARTRLIDDEVRLAIQEGAAQLVLIGAGFDSRAHRLNDAAGGPWHPHVMYFAPRTEDAAWGANFPGSPIASDSRSYDETTIFFVVVPNWSDGTPAPLHQ